MCSGQTLTHRIDPDRSPRERCVQFANTRLQDEQGHGLDTSSPTYCWVEACVYSPKICLGAVHRHLGLPSSVNSQCLPNCASLPRESGGERRQVVIATRFSPGRRGECTYRSDPDVGYMGGTTEDEALFGQPIPPISTKLGSIMARNEHCYRHRTEPASTKRTVHDFRRRMQPNVHVFATGFMRAEEA